MVSLSCERIGWERTAGQRACRERYLCEDIAVLTRSGIVMLGMNKLVNDRNPWVRKTVASGLSKIYEYVNGAKAADADG